MRIHPVGKNAVAIDGQAARAEPVSNVVAAANQGVEATENSILFLIVHVKDDPRSPDPPGKSVHQLGSIVYVHDCRNVRICVAHDPIGIGIRIEAGKLPEDAIVESPDPNPMIVHVAFDFGVRPGRMGNAHDMRLVAPQPVRNRIDPLLDGRPFARRYGMDFLTQK